MAKEKNGFISEFKKFISRGNVMDLAVGMIIGSSFTAIVNSLVNDMLMPVIGTIIGGINFSNLKIVIKEADEAAGIAEAAICYGTFIQAIVNFIIVAFAVFLLVKGINSLKDRAEALKKKEEEAAAAAPAPAPQPSAEEQLLTEIRDLLKNK